MLAVASLVAALTLGASAGAASTDLRIVAWPQGPGGDGAHVWRLRCDPVGGTLPRRATACSRLAKLDRPFAPVPKDVVCTQIYGGPQVARVTGTFRERRVWATLKRTDGCEISRWHRVRFLFPGLVDA